MTDYKLFQQICVEAVSCDRCFSRFAVERAEVDIAQPRYVGPQYWAATERLVFLMINPGAGSGSPSDRAMRQQLIRYRAGQLTLEELFRRQREQLPEWGRGKFVDFIRKCGVSLDDIALLNVAWCATKNNNYPSEMLKTCFEAHTKRALDALRPTKVVACGGVAQKFAQNAGIPFVPAPHYAARTAISFDMVRAGIGNIVRNIDFAAVGEVCAEVIVEAIKDRLSARKSGQTKRPHDTYYDVIRLVHRSNPKTGKSAKRFDCYRDGMTTTEYEQEVSRRLGADEARKCRKDIDWDVARNFIRFERK